MVNSDHHEQVSRTRIGDSVNLSTWQQEITNCLYEIEMYEESFWPEFLNSSCKVPELLSIESFSSKKFLMISSHRLMSMLSLTVKSNKTVCEVMIQNIVEILCCLHNTGTGSWYTGHQDFPQDFLLLFSIDGSIYCRKNNGIFIKTWKYNWNTIVHTKIHIHFTSSQKTQAF